TTQRACSERIPRHQIFGAADRRCSKGSFARNVVSAAQSRTPPPIQAKGLKNMPRRACARRAIFSLPPPSPTIIGAPARGTSEAGGVRSLWSGDQESERGQHGSERNEG